MRLYEFIEPPLKAASAEAQQAAISGDFELFSDIMYPILNSTASVHWLYFNIRQQAGIDEDADNKNAEAYRQKGLRGEFAYSGWG